MDYYLAKPNSLKLIALGSPDDIHEYLRINKLRGGISIGENVWFISPSRDFQDPFLNFSDKFESIEAMDTIPIIRNNRRVEYAFIYYLRGYKNPTNTSTKVSE